MELNKESITPYIDFVNGLLLYIERKLGGIMAYKGIVLIIIAAVAAVVLFLGLLCVLGFVATKKAWEHIMRDWENRDR